MVPLSLIKEARIHNGEKTVSTVNGVRKAGHSHVNEVKYLTPYTKMNSKWLKEFNIRQVTIKLLEGNIGKIFSDMNHSNIFLGQSTKTTEIKANTNKWDLIKLKSFCTTKEITDKIKTIYGLEENICNDSTDKGVCVLISNP